MFPLFCNDFALQNEMTSRNLHHRIKDILWNGKIYWFIRLFTCLREVLFRDQQFSKIWIFLAGKYKVGCSLLNRSLIVLMFIDYNQIYLFLLKWNIWLEYVVYIYLYTCVCSIVFHCNSQPHNKSSQISSYFRWSSN